MKITSLDEALDIIQSLGKFAKDLDEASLVICFRVGEECYPGIFSRRSALPTTVYGLLGEVAKFLSPSVLKGVLVQALIDRLRDNDADGGSGEQVH